MRQIQSWNDYIEKISWCKGDSGRDKWFTSLIESAARKNLCYGRVRSVFNIRDGGKFDKMNGRKKCR